MQIIQGIRDKGAAIVIAVIALSLIGFILMDAKGTGNRLFSSSSSSVGKINGSSIEQTEFNKRVKEMEDQQEQRSGMKPSVSEAAEMRDQTWNTMVAERVFFSEADKLGIEFTSKELSALLSSNDPENPLMQDKQMIDSATGRLDPNKVKQAFANIKKMTSEQRETFDAQILNPQRITSISTKYMALLNASAYYPTWMQERDAKQTKEFAQISYVKIPYTVISDSSIKVTDGEIDEYVKKHKAMFKQEAGRMISYVAFSELPSADDSARIKDVVGALKNDFAKDSNTRSFLARNTSSIEFDSSYLPKSKIRSAAFDSIARLQPGTVYGPYVDKGSYVLAKMLAVKSFPDSVKARHILIGTSDPQTHQPIMDDSVAKKLADSIYKAVKGGADFTLLAFKYSTDMGSKMKGGDLGTYGYGTMVPEFNDYSFNNPPGSIGVVHTQFGYHVINVESQKGSSNAYKVAFMAKDILASDATINKASLDATKLAADNDQKKFDTAYLRKMGLIKITVPTMIKENDSRAGNLQEARVLVKWAFDAKKGDISDPFNIGDQFIVATVDKIMDEGLQDAVTARPRAEAAVRQQKKGEEILKKLGSNPTVESAAAAYALKDTTAGADSSLTYSTRVIAGASEPKLIGAIFNKENQTKVAVPLLGNFSVYVFKVTSINQKPADTPEKAIQNKTLAEAQLRNQAASYWYEGLKNQATIKDNRSKFY
jgi:peptidyl-prolyl cis-trans isomerase D